MTIEIKGNWDKGFSYDVHTLDSVYLGPDESGHNQFKNTRSEMGELVFRLKYRNDKSVIKEIVDLLGKYKGISKFDAIIPTPSSKKNRPYQPVDEIALELGKRIDVEVLIGFLEKAVWRCFLGLSLSDSIMASMTTTNGASFGF